MATALYNLGLAQNHLGDKPAARAALARARTIYETNGRGDDVAACDRMSLEYVFLDRHLTLVAIQSSLSLSRYLTLSASHVLQQLEEGL